MRAALTVELDAYSSRDARLDCPELLYVVTEFLEIEAWLSTRSFAPAPGGLWESDDRHVAVALHEAGVFVGWCDVEWSHPSSPHLVLRDVRHVVPDLDQEWIPTRVEDAITQARTHRAAAVLVCVSCGDEYVPGHMHDEHYCQGCAERELGVMH